MNLVYVTGGAGFIGSNLCEKLIKLKYKVVALDNLRTGKKFFFKENYKTQKF